MMMNWAIGIDMYTLMCIKLMTNKNLLYKKINKIKYKNSKKKTKPEMIYWIKSKRKQNPVIRCLPKAHFKYRIE